MTAAVLPAMKPKSSFVSSLFYKFPQNAATWFHGVNLFWQGLAILLTYLFVVSGFDWSYYRFFRGSAISFFLFPAVFLGFFVPVLLPLLLLALGKLKKSWDILNAGYAVGQAAIAALALSWVYKAFTGRPGPPEGLAAATFVDTSQIFRFGWLRGGVFWGWPSSHTMVAFAVGMALFTMFPRNKLIRVLAVLYALYVGIGVSLTIHWFSDFAAGAIFGSIIGATVGKSFGNRTGFQTES